VGTKSCNLSLHIHTLVSNSISSSLLGLDLLADLSKISDELFALLFDSVVLSLHRLAGLLPDVLKARLNGILTLLLILEQLNLLGK